MEIIKGGVTAAKGFTASGMHVGLRRNVEKKDIALVYSDTMCNAAAVFTQNKIKANPIYVTSKHIQDGKAQAIIINSANANTFNGKEGLEHAFRMADATAEVLNLKPEDVLVASTGVIGEPLKIDLIENNVGKLAEQLSKRGHMAAREGIMTIDMIKKEITVSIDIDGKKVVVGGMAKGSGMIHPNMGTVLAFITSDIDIDQGLLREALRYATNKSFNRISVDGQTSTNDMAIVLANGKAGNKKVTEKDANYDIFLQALVYICTELAKLVARDGEGATKLIECVVEGAKTEETAARLSKAVITSTMVKAAIFGSDANWGRILCAIGCEGSEFDPNKIDIIFESKKGYIEVCKDGEPLKFNEKKARSILEDDEITIIVDLQMGDARANAWGCDLTYEYVRINGSYRS